MRSWKRIFRNPFRSDEPWSSVEEELDFHLEQKVQDLLAKGWEREEALREARRRFGDRRHWARRTVEESRRRRRVLARREIIDAFVDDVRTSVRHLRRRPLASVTAVAVLLGGLAISVPVLTILDHVLLRPAPFPDPDRVVWLKITTDQARFAGATFQASGGAYLDWKGRQDVFQVLAATQWSNVPIGEERPQRVRGLRVEPDFFDAVGVRPALGRAIRTDGADGLREVVLSHELWTSRFGADLEIVGRTVRVDGSMWEVVGVMPPGFRFWDMYGGETIPALLLSNPFVGWGGDPDLYTPAGRLQPVGRLARGVEATAAQERLSSMVRALREERPEVYVEGIAGAPVLLVVVPYLQLVREPIRRSLVFIGGATVLLLVVIVANVAGIFAAVVGDRVRELTLRSALGASRLRVVRQVLLENGILVVAAAALGSFVARVVLPLLKTRIPGSVPRLQDAGFDLRVHLAVAVVVGLLWILSSLPAVRHATRIDLRGVLAGGGHASTRRGGLLWLLGAQIAVTTALLATAGVLMENQRRIASVDPGFEPRGLQAIQLRAPEERYAEPVEVGEFSTTREGDFAEDLEVFRVDAAFTELVEQVLAQLRSVPGVQGATFVNNPPLPARGGAIWGTRLVGAEAGDGFIQKWTDPAYAEVVGLRVVRGRWIDARDIRGADPVVVVNQSFVTRHLDNVVDPLGHVVTFIQGVSGGGLDTSATIVGVVDDVLQDALEPGQPVLYQPLEQRATVWPDTQDSFAREASFIVRAESGPDQGAMREAVWSVDPTIPIDAHIDLSTALAGHLAQQRFFLILMAGFGVATLLMSAGGTGALVARRVQRARREIGVRRALGATGRGAGLEVLRDVILVAAAGAILGVAASFWVDGLLAAHIAGFSSDPTAVRLLTTATVLVVGFATAARPAGAATRVEPVEVLRAE